MYRIAIIDDSEINLTLFSSLVLKLGDCQTEVFHESVAGLAWCSENEPDLVIVDYMMPKMDGIEWIKRLRAVAGREEVPILMITANDGKGVRYEALQIGATDFLTKPVDRIELSARVRNMLELGARRKDLVEQVRIATAAIHAREQELVFRMSRAAEFRDPETGAHILRMAHYSRLIAAQLGLPLADQELILKAAPMHDIGKIGIADSILLKPGVLTSDEFEIMKTHARIGFDLLKESESSIFQAAASIALSHHEKYDGSGYPAGLSGEAIPLFGRIVAVADVFDALTSERPYKKAWPVERAKAYLLAGAGGHFDPRCVEVFLQGWGDVQSIYAQFRDDEKPVR